ncbi:NUDIX domain-containing protein [Candidatus Neomarinimicrobiota bacterium]
MNKKRRFCHKCGNPVDQRAIDERVRDYCSSCGTVYYDNPLPVVSAIVPNREREILLVLRAREPYANQWALPSGFVELNESVEQAVLRELKEETHIKGNIVKLLDTFSHHNKVYGDLIWVTFQIEHKSGKLLAGDDASETKFFPLSELPPLAFTANRRAVEKYLISKQDLWTMQDSFKRLERGSRFTGKSLPSNTLFEIITRDAHIITENWLADVLTHHSTKHYASQPHKSIYEKAIKVISQFAEWINRPGGQREDIWDYYRAVGKSRRKEGYLLSEVLSALSLTRKHIFAHVIGQGKVWREAMEMYQTMEFMSRVNLFFDKASYHISIGYES